MITKGEHVTDRPPRAFEIARRDLHGAPGVALAGEADVSSVPELTAALDAAIRASEGAFIVDLSDLDFLDSSGLSALLRARALLGQTDRAMAIVCPVGPVLRLFKLSGVDELFVLFRSREQAAAALVPPSPG
jgi:anti-sigma B factor antagonist